MQTPVQYVFQRPGNQDVIALLHVGVHGTSYTSSKFTLSRLSTETHIHIVAIQSINTSFNAKVNQRSVI